MSSTGAVGAGSASTVENIEGNSAQTEAYSEERVVDGKSIFLSAENAAKYDAEKGQEDRAFTVVTNGSAKERFMEAAASFFKGDK